MYAVIRRSLFPLSPARNNSPTFAAVFRNISFLAKVSSTITLQTTNSCRNFDLILHSCLPSAVRSLRNGSKIRGRNGMGNQKNGTSGLVRAGLACSCATFGLWIRLHKPSSYVSEQTAFFIIRNSCSLVEYCFSDFGLQSIDFDSYQGFEFCEGNWSGIIWNHHRLSFLQWEALLVIIYDNYDW